MTGAAVGETEEPLARRTGRGMAWAQLAKSLEALLTLGIAVAAVRALNPNAFGLYSLLTYLAGSASLLIPIVMVEGVGAVFPRFRDRQERVYLLGMLIVLRLAVLALAAFVLIPGWDVFRDWFGLSAISHRVLLVAVAYWIAQELVNSIAGFYLVELNLRPVALWRPVGLVVSLVAVIVVAATEDRWASSVGEVLAAVTAGYLVAAFGLGLGLRRYGRPRSPGREGVGTVLSFTRNTWLIGVVGFVLATHFDVLLIGAITADPGQAAFYVIAVGVIGRAQVLLISGWSALMIPALGEARIAGGDGGLALAWSLFSRLWLVVALPINVLLLVVARPLVELLFGSAYGEAGDLLVWVAAFNIATALLLGPPTISALFALDLQGRILFVRVMTAAVNVVLAVALIYGFEAVGAVIATGVASILTALGELVILRSRVPLDVPVRYAALVAAAAAAAALPGLAIQPDGAAGVAASLVLGGAVFVAALGLLRPLSREDLRVLERISPRLAASPLKLLVRP